jgi:hypothetical protein
MKYSRQELLDLQKDWLFSYGESEGLKALVQQLNESFPDLVVGAEPLPPLNSIEMTDVEEKAMKTGQWQPVRNGPKGSGAHGSNGNAMRGGRGGSHRGGFSHVGGGGGRGATRDFNSNNNATTSTRSAYQSFQGGKYMIISFSSKKSCFISHLISSEICRTFKFHQKR